MKNEHKNIPVRQKTRCGKIDFGKRIAVLTLLLAGVGVLSGCDKEQKEVVQLEAGEEIVIASPSESEREEKPAGQAAVVDASGQVLQYGSSFLDTGNLTETGNGYEGIPGTGDYNYGEALQKSLLFYELQRSGDLPEQTRCNWRGDSSLADGQDHGLDLTGGWYDAGDHVKFNLPMAYSAAMLGWSLYEDMESYEESGQLTYALGNIRWANDYFIKCHPEDEVYYYQVGNGSQDHTWWGPAELVEVRMDRPSYCVTKENPGSTVTAETAASLAIASILYEDIDAEYSALCLEHAISLYDFAESTQSDAGYTEANGFYNSHSGYMDELAWAGVWLYKATEEEDYLTKAEQFYQQADQNHKWAMCWDDVHIGAAVLLAELTEDPAYARAVEKHLDWWTVGTEGERITYTPKGLAWLDNWGALRYATTTAYIAALYSEMEMCSPEKQETYWDFAVSQANYALGDTGFSYMIGFGEEYPVNPHHRTAQGSYMDNMNEPSVGRHTLYGALVGGPDASDNYSDDVSNYNNNEVACDYNAGFTALLAKLYGTYHGETLVDFGAVEPIDENEFFVEAGVNVEGQDFVEIRAFVYNQTGWPARAARDVELRYFIDLSECIEGGADPSQIEVTTNYMQSGNVAGIKIWDEENHIYYLSVEFQEGDLYPGGQSQYKKEVQIRMRNPQGAWNNQNDPSFAGLSNGSMILATNMALYENGQLVFGTEPAAGEGAGASVVAGSGASGAAAGSGSAAGTIGGTTTGAGQAAGSQTVGSQGGRSENDLLRVTVEYTERGASVGSIAGFLKITNLGQDGIPLEDLAVEYFFTTDTSAGLNYSCYHAAVEGGSTGYRALNRVQGSFDDVQKDKADTVCRMTIGDAGELAAGETLTINFCINHSDWSSFQMTNDYSAEGAENIVITKDNQVIIGERP